MYRIILPALVFYFFQGYGQIAVQPGVLDFGSLPVDSIRTLDVKLDNKGLEQIELHAQTLFPEFTVEPASLVLSAGESGIFQVSFRPRHNIRYNDELLFLTANSLHSGTLNLKGEGSLAGYYGATFNLWDEELKDELRRIISANYRSLGYNTARDRMYGTIDNSGGNVTCVYTGRVATFNTRSGATQANFNTEHTWPQSMFNSDEPEKSDLHHLFPTFSYANSIRGNLPFGNVSSADWSEGGSKKGQGVFEVRQTHRGDAARAMFYFATRYRNYQSFLSSQESVLRTWSLEDPPDKKETDRNSAIFQEQKNRNPYVDFPRFLERINSLSSESVRPSAPHAFVSPGFITSDNHVLRQQDTFKIVLANDGNTAIRFDRVSLSSGTMTLVQAPGDLVEPGDAVVYSLVPSSWDINPPQKIADTLVLASAETTFRIPVLLEVQSVGISHSGRISDKMWFSEEKLHLRGLDGFALRIVDLSGRVVHFTEITASLTEIINPGLPAGVYFAEAYKGEQVFRLRFLLAD